MVALGERAVPTGQELLAEFIQYGNQKPFEEIVRRYAGMVFNTCFRVTKDKHEAEDATQAVFLTLALQARRGADIKALGPWLQQVAKRLALDTRRGKKRRKTREERFQAEQTLRQESILSDTLPSADMDELKTILHEELQKLPAKYRLPLILHYFGGLSRDEMAAELNCKPSTLGVRIFRGREMLAGRLSGRGVNISLGVLAVAMGYIVKRAVSESLIASTSHAATAIMAGYDGAGFASANVIGLTRRATSSLAIGKIRLAAVTMMMAGTSLGAGARALGVLPQMNLQQLITNQMNKIIRPLLTPFSVPMRVDAQSLPSQPKAIAATPALSLEVPLLVQVPVRTTAAAAAIAPVILPAKPSAGASDAGNNLVVNFADSPLQSTFSKTEVSAVKSSDDAPTAAGSGDRTASTASSTSATADTSDILAASSTESPVLGGTGGYGAVLSRLPVTTAAAHFVGPISASTNLPDFTLYANDIVVGSNWSVSRSSISGSVTGSISAGASAASQIAIIQVPSVNGLVTESSSGVLRGYGLINKTGTLIISSNGQVVADGMGIDRTLDLRSITSIRDTSATISTAVSSMASVTNPTLQSKASFTANTAANTAGVGGSAEASVANGTAPGGAAANDAVPVPTLNPNGGSAFSANADSAGWYAVNHGRLSMSLESGADKSVLTWGEDPNSTRLNLVNSVRLTIDTDGDTGSCGSVPSSLSLLAPDRSDAPGLSQMFGVPIGLWQVGGDSGPDAAPLCDTDISVRYDGLLADELGAAPSSISLWTLGGPGSCWQQVNPASTLLDTSDDLISGYAGSDVSYFAVSVTPAAGTDVQQLIASHLSLVASQPVPSIGLGSSVVPEPTTVLPIFATAGLLSRRRRSRSRVS